MDKTTHFKMYEYKFETSERLFSLVIFKVFSETIIMYREFGEISS